MSSSGCYLKMELNSMKSIYCSLDNLFNPIRGYGEQYGYCPRGFTPG